MSPGAYAERVNGQVRMSETYLNGTRIYFFGGDRELATVSTKAKMFRLARCGATLVPEYNPDIVTHIVIDDNIVSLHHLLENISVKRLSKVPGHIPILKWPWATTDNTKKHFRIHAAFATRRNSVDAIDYDPDINPIVPPAPKKGKEHAAPNPEVTNSSGEQMVGNPSAKSPREASSSSSRGLEDEEASFEKQRVSSKPRANSDPANENNVGEDPLAEFYAQARTERDQEVQENLGDGNKATNLHAENGNKSHSSGSRFLCDGVRTSAGQCPNQDVIDKLSELKKIHEQRLMTGDNFRVLKYSTAINALRAYPKRIRSTEEAMSLNGVAKKTAEKIMEIIRTGDLQRLHHERAVSDDIRVIELFQGIYGVGRQIAHRWYNAGCRTLDDLREGKGGVKLSSVQQIGLQYYDDINSRMPRAEAEEIFNKIKPFALKIDSKLYVDIMGSFRRGKADCGDIDIIITRPTDDGRNHSGVLSKLLKDLRIAGIITEDLSIPDDWSDLELCYRGLCRKDSDSRRRRIDFLVIPWESRGAALLYYTGDDIFNRSMRLKANKMGYSLNQKGLFAGVVRDPQDRTRKLNQGTNIASATEREIFDKLGVPWQEPHERVRGFS
ncbi:hypothetical protein QCA50_012402 [Cerrena zonata]|uniref:DNA polymerase n=1 Tax=Cerrena zonata TaxID=2478898 RepID=A0AAW0G014_9APHY